MYRDYMIPVAAAIVICILAIVAVQKFRFDCVDVGFYKSCGVSTIR